MRSGRLCFSPTATAAPSSKGEKLLAFQILVLLGAALKNKLQLVGVLKRSVSSSSTYFFFPFIAGGEEVGTSRNRGMALLLFVKYTQLGQKIHK